MSNKKETKIWVKHTNAMLKKLPKKNRRYYVLGSESIGLRFHVELNGAKSFHLQRYFHLWIIIIMYYKKMKVVILANRYVTRLTEYADKIPKPMVSSRWKVNAKSY
jgi:hypothetical protein